MYIEAHKYNKKTREYYKENMLLFEDPADVLTEPDGELVPVFDFRTFPFREAFNEAQTFTKQGHGKDRIEYLNLITSFDIETTTIQDSDKPFAFMYHWQFCLEEYVFFGRTWEDFNDLMAILQKALDLHIELTEDILTGRSLVVYIHNLAYEFQFMRRFLPKIVNPLITDKYAPLLIPCINGLTFRCSARLSNMSLEKFTKGYPHAKLAGDLDYSIQRTPKSKLTNLEKCYCYNDVRGLNEAIKDLLEHEEYNIATMPLTSTGFVRNDCRKAMATNPQNKYQFKAMALSEHLYNLCREAFRGGNTHGNHNYVGKLLSDVKSGDIASSYPATILTRTFPMGPFKPIKGEYILNNWNHITKSYCLLIKCVFTNIQYKGSTGMPYLSRSKCFFKMAEKDNLIEDNGRIYSAPFLQTTVTEIDLFLIYKDYKFDDITILEAYAAPRAMLPDELRSVCFNYYQKKTLLKGTEDPDEIYMYNQAKARLNAIYGCMVMRIDRIEYDYDDDYVNLSANSTLKDQLEHYYSSPSSFLSYQWGVWVTAWARYALYLGQNCAGSDAVYCDTDSVKYIGDHEDAFNELNKKLEATARRYGAVATNRNGVEFPIGVYDQEKSYLKFKTLGAKKYIYTYDNTKICATISGVGKKAGADYFTANGFEAFTDGCSIPECGKIVAYYNDDPIHILNIGGCEILTASSVALIEGDYTIHMKPDYLNFLDYICKSIKKYYNVG